MHLIIVGLIVHCKSRFHELVDVDCFHTMHVYKFTAVMEVKIPLCGPKQHDIAVMGSVTNPVDVKLRWLSTVADQNLLKEGDIAQKLTTLTNSIEPHP